MPQSIQQFFTQQAIYLRDGHIDALIRPYAKPLVVDLPDGRRPFLLPSRDACAAFFRAKMEGLASVGVDYLRAMVPDYSAERGGRVTASVVWYYIADARQAGETEARYFISRHNGQFQVEMITFERLALPALADWLDDAGRRAVPVEY